MKQVLSFASLCLLFCTAVYSQPGYENISFRSSILNTDVHMMVQTTQKIKAGSHKVPLVFMSNMRNDVAAFTTAVNQYALSPHLPPAIIVGLSAGDEKVEEESAADYTDPKHLHNKMAGGEAAYLRMLLDEAKPYLEKRYKCETQKVLDGSRHCDFVDYVLAQQPAAFDAYISGKPFAWMETGGQLQSVQSYFAKAPIAYAGATGLDKIECHEEVLLKKGRQ